ncbi:MAG: hypothetical protein IKS32_00905 [Solobacterium sp.]|nr:hypothetical protein [Solobacterium sp.]
MERNDGVYAAITELQIRRNRDSWFTVQPRVIVTNRTEEALMRIDLELQAEDTGETGQPVLHTVTWNGGDTPLVPGQNTEVMRTGFFHSFAGEPGRVTVKVTDVKTAAELPPVRLPKPGELLYLAAGNGRLAGIRENPPVCIQYVQDNNGAQTITEYRRGSGLEEALNRFCRIRIRKETELWMSDHYNRIILERADGSKDVIQLNGKNYEFRGNGSHHIYELDGLNDLLRVQGVKCAPMRRGTF